MSGRESVIQPWVEGSVDESTGIRVATARVDVVSVIIGVVTAGVCAALAVGLDAVVSGWLFVSPIFGAAVALLIGRRAVDPGRGLVWAGAIGVLTWFAYTGAGILGVPGVPSTRGGIMESFFMLFIGLGVPTGVAVGLWHAYRDADERQPIDFNRAVVVGGLSGLIGGLVFSIWMHQVGLFPLIAGIVGSTSVTIGLVIHFNIAFIIGVSYGFLFQRDTRGFGSSLTWGMAYGFVWWVLGGLTLYPLLLGNPIAWSPEAVYDYNFIGFLVGHVVYGLFLGIVYAMLDRAWLVLFYETDPLNYDVDGPSLRTMQSMGWGLLASMPGIVIFGAILWYTGEMRWIAGIVGLNSMVVGTIIHVIVGAIIGMSYGRLFRYESPNLGAGIMWGIIYGQIWWFAGPLTLLPMLTGDPLTWTISSVLDALPWLVGHYLYGGLTGAGFYLLERRRKAWARVNTRIAAHERRRQRYVGTPAPAVWVIVLGMCALLFTILLHSPGTVIVFG